MAPGEREHPRGPPVERRLLREQAELRLALVPSGRDTLWWFYDSGKARSELGFATRPLEETIAATAAHYRPQPA